MRILQAHLNKTYKNLGAKYTKSRKFSAIIYRHPSFKIPLAFVDHICITLFSHFPDDLTLKWKRPELRRGSGIKPIVNYYSQQEIVNLYVVVAYYFILVKSIHT